MIIIWAKNNVSKKLKVKILKTLFQVISSIDEKYSTLLCTFLEDLVASNFLLIKQAWE